LKLFTISVADCVTATVLPLVTPEEDSVGSEPSSVYLSAAPVVAAVTVTFREPE
jgi:hypothetical protein